LPKADTVIAFNVLLKMEREVIKFRVLIAAVAISLSACSSMPSSTDGVRTGMERFRVPIARLAAAQAALAG